MRVFKTKDLEDFPSVLQRHLGVKDALERHEGDQGSYCFDVDFALLAPDPL